MPWDVPENLLRDKIYLGDFSIAIRPGTPVNYIPQEPPNCCGPRGTTMSPRALQAICGAICAFSPHYTSASYLSPAPSAITLCGVGSTHLGLCLSTGKATTPVPEELLLVEMSGTSHSRELEWTLNSVLPGKWLSTARILATQSYNLPWRFLERYSATNLSIASPLRSC
jgi:hypothetical protein